MAVLVNLLTGTTTYPNVEDAAAVVSGLSEAKFDIIVDALASELISSDSTISKGDLKTKAEAIVNKVKLL